MEYRKLNGTDLEISAITYGSMTFAATANTPDRDTDEGLRALELALDMGVNCVHSSHEYGTRYAIGEVLRKRKDAHKIHHVIKVRTFGRAEPDVPQPYQLRRRVEAALEEMGAERIDLIQWIVSKSFSTNPEPGQADEFMAHLGGYRDEIAAEFEKLRDEGKAGYLGFFAYSDEFAGRMVDSSLISCLMFYYNLWDTTILPTLDRLGEANMSALAYRPFSGGMLTAKRADRSNLPEGDKYLPEKRMQLLIDRDRLFEAVGLESDNLTETAVKFCLSHPNVASLVTGLNTRDQVREILPMADGDYPGEDLARKLFDACRRLSVGARL